MAPSRAVVPGVAQCGPAGQAEGNRGKLAQIIWSFNHCAATAATAATAPTSQLIQIKRAEFYGQFPLFISARHNCKNWAKLSNQKTRTMAESARAVKIKISNTSIGSQGSEKRPIFHEADNNRLLKEYI